MSALDSFKHIRDGLVEDVKRAQQQEKLTFNRILICGDVAFSGAEEQYKRAEKFIRELCEVTGLNYKEDVFVVPGNHDKNWYEGAKEVRELINRYVIEMKDPNEALGQWLKNDLHSASLLFGPFKNYDKFVEKFGCAEPLMHRMNNELMNSKSVYSEDEDKLYWCDDLAEINGYKILLYGLNSALFSDKEDYDTSEARKYGHQMVLSKLAYNEVSRKDGEVNVMMMHHPMPYIYGGEKLKDELDKLYHIQLYGHVHVAKSDNNNNRIHIFSGAMQPDEMGTGEEYRPIYNIIEIDIENGDEKHDKLNVKLQERCWNGTIFQNYRDEQDYTVKLPKYKWKREEMTETRILPEGVTKHTIRVKLINHGRAKSIITKLAPDFYDENLPKYYNVMRFLEKVRLENKWKELWDAMEE